MKSLNWIVTALLVVSPLAAQASCESVKADISLKIISNGVPESSFSLDIVPNDQAEQAGGQVVGHCESDSQKIVYKRTGGGESTVSSSAGSSQDSTAQ